MPTEKNRQTYLHFKNLLNGNREKHGKECNKKKKGNRKKGNEYNNNKKKNTGEHAGQDGMSDA